MKKTAMLLSLLLLLGAPCPARALEVSARSAVLIEPITGRILYEKNKAEKLPMASTTKIVTAITALEHGDLSDLVVTSKAAANVEGSSIWLAEGEEQTLEDLLYGLMLSSGNDAAIAIAEHIGGSIDNFALLMNQTAREAGAVNSSFQNPNGLDEEGHYTTAEDLAKITAYGMKNDLFRKIVATKSHSIPWEGHEWNRTLQNHNKLLRTYDGCDGVKTGFTKKSGRCLVSSATRNGIQLIAVTLNAPNDWEDHRKMLDEGFSKLTPQTVVSEAMELPSLEVKGGTMDQVALRPAQSLTLPLMEGDRTEVKLELPNPLEAPVELGQPAGFAQVYLNDAQVGEVELICAEPVEAIPRPGAGRNFFEVFKDLLRSMAGLQLAQEGS